MTTYDEVLGRIKAKLAERGLHIPDIVERIGALEDPQRLEEIAKNDLLLDLFATTLATQVEYMKRQVRDLFIVSAESDEALKRLTVTLGVPGKTPDGGADDPSASRADHPPVQAADVEVRGEGLHPGHA